MKTQDICDRVTQAVIAELEKGTMPWTKPWTGAGGPVMPRRHSGARYRGINILLLWSRAEETGFRSSFWMTFKQAQEYGGCVRKGEKGTQIVYTNRVTKSETNDAGEDVERNFGFLKSYTVFNAEQIDNLPDEFSSPVLAPEAVPTAKNWAAYGDVFAWFEAIPAEVRHQGDKAMFIPSLDRIELPERDAFNSAQSYFSTRGHETVHWAGGKSRLARDLSGRFGDKAYAMEELIAELGAAFTMAELGLVPAIREDHAPYIAQWLAVLKNDSRAILTAAAKASDALEFLSNFQPASAAEPDEVEVALAADRPWRPHVLLTKGTAHTHEPEAHATE